MCSKEEETVHNATKTTASSSCSETKTTTATTSSSSTSLLPAHIHSYLLEKFRFVPTNVEEVKSAQQRVLVVAGRRRAKEKLLNPNPAAAAAAAATKQDGNNDDSNDNDDNRTRSNVVAEGDDSWEQLERALSRGNDRVVVRIWMGTCRWWTLNRRRRNCNCNSNSNSNSNSAQRHDNDRDDDELRQMAASEIAGYRIAKLALSSRGCNSDRNEGNFIRIPTVLYSSEDDNDDNHAGGGGEQSLPGVESADAKYPWAVLEYVGRKSNLFSSSSEERCCYYYNSYWVDTMVKVRNEFGYDDEPHPQWGRVPANECLEYALTVLRQVTIPIHRYCLQQQQHEDHNKIIGVEKLCGYNVVGVAGDDEHGNIKQANGYSYSSMLGIYKGAHRQMVDSLDDDGHNNMTQPAKLLLHRAVDLLRRAIQRLAKESEQYTPPLESTQRVLCHMDCQPQNLLFATAKPDVTTADNHNNISVASVLDWEESAYADPRFEVLLLCRKVCANRQQAQILWDTYAHELPAPNLGPIEPWLKLETVHSLTTLLMQSMDMGGRSPWESKPDLWDKIEREVGRLKAYGWEFCEINI